jgi:hypothetical protein
MKPRIKTRIPEKTEEEERKLTEEDLHALLKDGMLKMIKIIAAAELQRRGYFNE